jgi:hypothetical protein
MRRRLALILAVAGTVPLLADASAACSTSHMVVYLDGRPPEAASRPLYWVVEGTGAGATNVGFSISLFGGSCNGEPVTVSYRTLPGTASQTDYGPPPNDRGAAAFSNTGAHSDTQPFALPIIRDVEPEGAFQTAVIELHDPQGGAGLGPVPRADVVIVDDDAPAAQISLLGGDYRHPEGYPGGGVPVFRGGDAGSEQSVGYTIEPMGGPNPATPDDDYGADASGSVTFPAGQRVAMIPIDVLGDDVAEPDERLQVSISGPPTVGQTTSATFAITDVSGVAGPLSTLHHPRQRLKYRADDYRIREVHVFTQAAEGIAVVGAEFALRRNLRGGRCQWLVGRRFKKGPCGNERWLKTKQLETDFYYYRMKVEPAPSTGRIKSYTAFSRAFDAVGRLERRLMQGRNANTFEVKPPRGG